MTADLLYSMVSVLLDLLPVGLAQWPIESSEGAEAVPSLEQFILPFSNVSTSG